MAEREALFNAILVGRMHSSHATQSAPPLRVLRLEQMALARAGPKHLAAGSNLKALGHRFLCFNALRTSHNSMNSNPKERAI